MEGQQQVYDLQQLERGGTIERVGAVLECVARALVLLRLVDAVYHQSGQREEDDEMPEEWRLQYFNNHGYLA